MDTKTVEKLEYILSGTGTTEDEKNEIIDLMEDYAQEQAKLFDITDVNNSVCGHSAQFLHSHENQYYCSECDKYYDYPKQEKI